MSAWKAWAELAVGGLVIAVSAIGIYATWHADALSCEAKGDAWVYVVRDRACIPYSAIVPAR